MPEKQILSLKVLRANSISLRFPNVRQWQKICSSDSSSSSSSHLLNRLLKGSRIGQWAVITAIRLLRRRFKARRDIFSSIRGQVFLVYLKKVSLNHLWTAIRWNFYAISRLLFESETPTYVHISDAISKFGRLVLCWLSIITFDVKSDFLCIMGLLLQFQIRCLLSKLIFSAQETFTAFFTISEEFFFFSQRSNERIREKLTSSQKWF